MADIIQQLFSFESTMEEQTGEKLICKFSFIEESVIDFFDFEIGVRLDVFRKIAILEHVLMVQQFEPPQSMSDYRFVRAIIKISNGKQIRTIIRYGSQEIEINGTMIIWDVSRYTDGKLIINSNNKMQMIVNFDKQQQIFASEN